MNSLRPSMAACRRLLPRRRPHPPKPTGGRMIDRAASRFSFLQDNMNSPARACALSHFKAWERAAQQSKEDGLHHLVNEDDFKNADLSQLPALIEEVARSPFDIIYLGYRGGGARAFGLRPSLQRRLAPPEIRDVLPFIGSLDATELRASPRTPAQPAASSTSFTGMTWGGHAYLMNARGAEVLMEANRSLRFLPDEALQLGHPRGQSPRRHVSR